MKQFVLHNPKNAKLAVAIKINFFDGCREEPLMSVEGYSIALRSVDDFDGWLIDNEDGVWVYSPKELLEQESIEIWGEL